MIEVLKQALEALERSVATCFYQYAHQQVMSQPDHFINQAITSLRQAIAELESQEPVAWRLNGESSLGHGKVFGDWKLGNPPADVADLASVDKNWSLEFAYTTHPPQRTWQRLTDEELRIDFGKLYPSDIGILELAENNKDYAVEAIGARHHWTAFKAGARAGEAKLKEKNS